MLRDIEERAETLATRRDRPETTLPPSASDELRVQRLATTSPPLMTPGGSEAPSLMSLQASLDDVSVSDKPTTLSGAASQVDLDRKKSRKGLGLAMAAAALLAGGGVAFYKLRFSTSSVAPAAAPAPSQAAAPAPAVAPAPVVEPPIETKAEPPIETKAEPPVEPKIEPPPIASPTVDPVVVEKKKQPKRRKPVAKPTTPTEPVKPVEVKKPEQKPTLPIERDIE
jgi:hypothetical protein